MQISHTYPNGDFQMFDTDYPFGCQCGESYKTAEAAWGCRKCRDYLYLDDFINRKVYHGFPGIGDGVKVIERAESA